MTTLATKKTMTSAAGSAMWPALNTPDTKWNPDGGDWKVNLRVEAADAEPMMDQIKAVLEEYKAAQITRDPKLARYTASYPFDDELDDQGNLTGYVIFKFKQKARILTRDGTILEMSVGLFDAKRKPTKAVVGAGSTIKVAANLVGYSMPTSKSFGISLKPSAVQIISLVSGAGASAAMFEDEDGFESTDTVDTSVPSQSLSEALDDSVDF